MNNESARKNANHTFDALRPWSTTNHPWMEAAQYMYEQLLEQDPTVSEVDDPDPMIRTFAARNKGRIPPHKFWDTTEMWEQARSEHMHPFTIWSMRSATPAEANDPEYIAWIASGY